MRYKPEHTCFHPCAGCAYELGEQNAKRKPCEHAKYVWAVVGSNNPCDIRRYAFSHHEGVEMLSHIKKRKGSRKGSFKDTETGGTWTLFKLVQVDKRNADKKV